MKQRIKQEHESNKNQEKGGYACDAHLCRAAAVHDDDHVVVDDGLKAVRNGHHRGSLEGLSDNTLQDPVRHQINVAASFILYA